MYNSLSELFEKSENIYSDICSMINFNNLNLEKVENNMCSRFYKIDSISKFSKESIDEFGFLSIKIQINYYKNLSEMQSVQIEVEDLYNLIYGKKIIVNENLSLILHNIDANKRRNYVFFDDIDKFLFVYKNCPIYFRSVYFKQGDFLHTEFYTFFGENQSAIKLKAETFEELQKIINFKFYNLALKTNPIKIYKPEYTNNLVDISFITKEYSVNDKSVGLLEMNKYYLMNESSSRYIYENISLRKRLSDIKKELEKNQKELSKFKLSEYIKL